MISDPLNTSQSPRQARGPKQTDRPVVSGTAEPAPALVLNADFRPLSYFPLSLWPWQDAVKAVFLKRVTIVSEYDRTVSSPSFELRLPSGATASPVNIAATGFRRRSLPSFM